MKILTTLFAAALMLMASCAKNGTPDECVTNNYGVEYYYFNTDTIAHQISSTLIGTVTTRTKTIPLGVLIDSIHYAPGTWNLYTSQTSGGTLTHTTPGSVVVSQCVVDTQLVDF